MTLMEEFKEYQRLRDSGIPINEIFSLLRTPEENENRKLYKGFKPWRPDTARPDYKFKIVGGPLDGKSIEQMPREWERSFSNGWYSLSNVGKNGKYYWREYTYGKGGGRGVSSNGAVGIAALNAFMPR